VRFEVVARRRPVRLVVPDAAPVRAPYVATSSVTARELTLASGGVTLTATYADRVTLHVSAGGRTTTHRSRRSGRPRGPVEEVALALTGPQVTAFTREAGTWVARARHDLTDRHDVHEEGWLAGLAGSGTETGRFGQLGLRDLRVVSHADGSPYVEDGAVLLTATSAGPGGFPTGHCSVWSLDVGSLELEHRADLFLRRGGVFGDHAAHLVRDGDRWLLAASTWGDFDRRKRPVGVVLGESVEELTRGVHVVDGRPLELPVDGFTSVGVWDPHLVRSDEGWWVGYVSATKYFRFHPVLAAGPALDSLALRAVGTGRETEGTTLARVDGPQGPWRVLVSDKRRRCYPALDLDLHEVGTLDAAYPSNIPWPTLVAVDGQRLLIGFNGAPCGGRLVGYGSHGDVVLQRAVSP
jgi:hypothetical protein